MTTNHERYLCGLLKAFYGGLPRSLQTNSSQQAWICRNTVTDIAEVFRIRQQRVMAIIALHMVEQRSKAQGLPMHDHFRLMMEGDYVVDEDGDYVHSGIDPCFEAVGSGERHVKILPRAPHYEVNHWESTHKYFA